MSKEDITNNGHLLPIIEQFYSLQGEGHYYGTAAYFIRIGGCDIACNWCDAKYAWNADLNDLIPIEIILDNLLQSNANTLLVTGGEPLNYNLEPLCVLMKKYNIKTHLETSGFGRLTGIWDWICISPKKNFPPFDENYDFADELKVIIENEDDFEWAEYNALKVKKDCILFLQPEWSKRKTVTPLIVDYIKKNTKWRLSLQTHKFINIP